MILEELPTPVLEGAVRQVAAWSTPKKVLKNLNTWYEGSVLADDYFVAGIAT